MLHRLESGFVSLSPDRKPLRSGLGPPVGTAVLGAGPAGLTAAYVLGLAGRPGAVFEADDVVGGIAKTIRSAATGSTSAAIASSRSFGLWSGCGTRCSATSA
jgi:hypothetical protein